MPRTKRPLRELDSNASNPATPPRKRAKTTHIQQEYGALNKTELVRLAQESGLPRNGRKEDLIQRLEGFDEERNRGKRGKKVKQEVKEKEEEEEEQRTKREPKSSPVRLRQVRIGNSVFIRSDREDEVASVDYSTRDNKKLRVLLDDRDLFSDGKSREEMISLLLRNPVDYESFTFDELTEKLKGRGLTNAAGCTKQVKIDRLKWNDLVDRHTGDYVDMQLYVSLHVYDNHLTSLLKTQEEAKTTNKFSSWTIKRLQHRLNVLKLSANGTQQVLAKRVGKFYEKQNTKEIAEYTAKRDETKVKLEASTGRSFSSSPIFKEECELTNQDTRILEESRNKKQPKTPICDYDWTNSHWAERTQREISEICCRREMPGHGVAPKAAQLKWLDTGSVEYADFYITGLQIMCRERGIKHKDEAKKEYYIALLEEDDDREETH